MKFKLFFLGVLFLFEVFVFQLDAVVIECKKIADVKKYVSSDACVFFDIDNTLMHPKDAVGREEWVWGFIKYLEKSEGLDNLSAAKKMVKYYFDAQFKASVEAIEEGEDGSAGVIDYLQKLKIPVMGLTSRSAPLIEHTSKQLSSIGIHFDKTAYCDRNISVKKFCVGVCELNHPAQYSNGILFCSFNSKANVVFRFFDLVKKYRSTFVKPKKIIFVDDCQSYIEDMDKQLTSMGIEFVGLRYSFLDDAVDNFVFTKEMLPANYVAK